MNYNFIAQKFFNKEYIDLSEEQMFQVADAVATNTTEINNEKFDVIKLIGRFDIEDIKILIKAMRKIDDKKIERTIFLNYLNCECIKKFQTKEDVENFHKKINEMNGRELESILFLKDKQEE